MRTESKARHVDRVLRFGVEVEHDRDDLVGELVVDLLPKEQDPLTVQAVVKVDPVRLHVPRHFVRNLIGRVATIGRFEGMHETCNYLSFNEVYAS